MKPIRINEKIIQKSLDAAKRTDPIIFAGMFDSGIDFIYAHLIHRLENIKTSYTKLILDFSGCTSTDDYLRTLQVATTYEKFQTVVCSNLKRPYVIFFYTGQQAYVDPQFLLTINRIRQLHQKQVSYVWFTSTRVVFNALYSGTMNPLIKKILTRNIYPISLKDESDAKLVMEDLERVYSGSLSEKIKNNILLYAGGNPGLMKAMYLQALDTPSWKQPNLYDERLSSRLEGIIADIPKELQFIFTGKTKNISPSTIELLVKYGYLIKQDDTYIPFTKLISQCLLLKNVSSEQTSFGHVPLLLLSPTQRSVLSYFESHMNIIISRDQLAEVIWSSSWQDKYSNWAIDQFISTLREKLSMIKPTSRIITKKGEGYIFIP